MNWRWTSPNYRNRRVYWSVYIELTSAFTACSSSACEVSELFIEVTHCFTAAFTSDFFQVARRWKGTVRRTATTNASGLRIWATSWKKTTTTKWHVRPAKTRIGLGIRPVWSESSLCAQWVAKDPSFLHADCEDTDQTRWMPRLIWVFAGLTCHSVGFVIRRLNYKAYYTQRVSRFYKPWVFEYFLFQTLVKKESKDRGWYMNQRNISGGAILMSVYNIWFNW